MPDKTTKRRVWWAVMVDGRLSSYNANLGGGESVELYSTKALAKRSIVYCNDGRDAKPVRVRLEVVE